jgi:hypothetical protein
MTTTPGDKATETPTNYLLWIRCECGKTLVVPAGGWLMNIVGMLQFKCPCGAIINAPDAAWNSARHDAGAIINAPDAAWNSARHDAG